MNKISVFILFLFLSNVVAAQSNYKEGSNSFARYMQSGDVKQLESAKKFIDDAYKTKRDSTNSRHSILRAMIYSSIAYIDSTRKIKTDRDPIFIATTALSNIRPKHRGNFETEINYVNQNLLAAYLYKANKSISEKAYDKAYENFLKVNELNPNNTDVLNNLAMLATQANKTDDAISYYIKLIEGTDASVNKYLELAELYTKKQNGDLYLKTLLSARDKYRTDKTVLFLLIQHYAEKKNYAAIVPIIDQAISYDTKNIYLNYLAGFSNENENNIEEAKKHYQNVIALDENHYDANLALGLIFLNDFLKNNNNLEAQYNAQEFLLKANGIKPYGLNTLKGLAMYYEKTEDLEQLDRVNVLINQLSNN